MLMRLRTTLRNTIGGNIVADIDSGSGPGYLRFYDGAMPANIATPVTSQVLLGTLTFSDPSGTLADGIVTFAPISQDNAADNSGIAAWARAFNSDGDAIADYDVSDLLGTGAIKLNTVNIVAGGPIRVAAFTIRIGN